MKFWQQHRATPIPRVEDDEIEQEHRALVERTLAAMRAGTADADMLARSARKLQRLEPLRRESARLAEQCTQGWPILKHTVKVGNGYAKFSLWSWRKAAALLWFNTGLLVRSRWLRARGR